MAEIVNLRLARKAKRRRDADATAAANRARHGQTQGERAVARLEAARIARTVDGARLDAGED